MKKIFLLLGLLAQTSLAGLPPTQLSTQGGTAATTFKFVVPNQQATVINGVQSLIETGNTNLLTNPTFQASIASNATTGWQASLGFGTPGTFTADVTAANRLEGSTQAGLLTYGASTTGSLGLVQTYAPATIAGLQGLNMAAQIVAKTASANWVLAVSTNGATVASVSLPATGTYQPTTLNFVTNSATTSITYQVYDTTSSTAATLDIGSTYLGRASNLAYVQNSTDWVSYTPTFGAGWGTVTNIAFYYRRVGDSLQVQGTFTDGTVAASLGSISLPSGLSIDTTKNPLNNTTSNAGVQVGIYFSNTQNQNGTIVTATATDATKVYTTPGIGQTQGSNLTPANVSTGLNSSQTISIQFTVPIVGWTSNQAGYRGDVTPASINVTSSLSATTTSTTYATVTGSLAGSVATNAFRNMSCVAASSVVGITCTLPRIGNYQVCFTGYATNSSTGNNFASELVDGSGTIIVGQQITTPYTAGVAVPFGGCGNYTAASSSSTFQLYGKVSAGTGTYTVTSFSVIELDAPMPAPYLVGSVLSNSTSNAYRIESAQVTVSSSAAAVVSQSGSWLSMANGAGAGLATGTITSGEFSGVPSCSCTIIAGASTSAQGCGFTAEPTTTTLLFTRTAAGAATNGDVNVICMGQH